MQSSESAGLPPNSLSTEASIKQGCIYFASLVKSSKELGVIKIVLFKPITMVAAI